MSIYTEYRLNCLQKLLINEQAVLITSKESIFYYTGLYSDDFFVLVTSKRAFIFTDQRSIGLIPQFLHSIYKPILVDSKVKNTITRLISKNKIVFISFELSTPYSKLKWFKNIFKEARFKEKMFYTPKSQSQSTRYTALPKTITGITKLDDLRRVKDISEISAIQKSLEKAESIMTIIRQKLIFGISEKNLSIEIHKLALNMGCKELSFSPIVAFGKHSAIPHHIPTDKQLNRRDIALVDLGVKYRGYCSDITRTFFASPTSSLQIKMYNMVADALCASTKVVSAGVKASKIYTAVCIIFQNQNFQNLFTHAAGHGVGLAIHETPSLSLKNKQELYENEIVTIEPGLYSKDYGGIRLENMILVKKERGLILNKLPINHDFAIIRQK